MTTVSTGWKWFRLSCDLGAKLPVTDETLWLQKRKKPLFIDQRGVDQTPSAR